MLKCEFHVPISPTPDFLCRVHYLAASIDRWSGLRSHEYRIVVTVGDAQQVDLDALCPWSRLYPLEWRWIDAEHFARRWYWATAYQRYCYDHDAETVVMLDGDVLVTGPLDDVIERVRGTRRLAAVQAYFSPLMLVRELLQQHTPRGWWQWLFDAVQVPLPEFTAEHIGWRFKRGEPIPGELLRWGPPNPNAGVVVASAATVREISQHIFQDIDTFNTLCPTVLNGQVALTAAIARLRLEWTPLPLRYNFQNLPDLREDHLAERADIRVLHFLSRDEVDRVKDFASYETVQALFGRTLRNPVNQLFVQRLQELHLARVGAEAATCQPPA